MSDKEIKEKIKKITKNPGTSLEKGVKKSWEATKHFGKDIKDSKSVDALEEGTKKSWGAIKNFGKNVKNDLKKKEEEEK